MRPRYTASALERVLACPPSVLLPQVWQTTNDAARGTSIHAFVRNVLAGVPYDEALRRVDPQWRETCRAIDFARLGADLRDVRAEAAYAWDTRMRSARFLGYNIGRNYDVSEGEIAGTSDIEGIRLDDVPVVGDVKTGDGVTRCEDNAQMLFHAMVKRSMTGAEEVQGRLIYIGRDGSVTIDPFIFDAFALDAFADRVEEADGAIDAAAVELETRGMTPVTKGEWCKYCPAMQACPAWVGMARRIVVDIEDIRIRLEALTDEELAKAWIQAKQGETLFETVLEGLKGIVKQRGILELGDGSKVKPIAVTRNTLDGKAAVALLRHRGASSEEIAKLYKENSSITVRRVGTGGGRKRGPRTPRALPQGPLDIEALERIGDPSGDFDVDPGDDGEAA